MSSTTFPIHFLPYIILMIQIQSGWCNEDYPAVDNGIDNNINNMEAPHSLAISKEWALHFDRMLGRNDESLSESQKMEIENNLIEVAELLHFVPPGVLPRKTPHVFPPHPLDHAVIPSESTIPPPYVLKGTKPPPVEKVVKLPVPSDLEPSFTLALEVTTSKPKVIGHISKPKVETEPSSTSKPPAHETSTSSTTQLLKPNHSSSSHDDSGKGNHETSSQIHPAQERLTNMLKLKLNLESDHKFNRKLSLFADSRQRKNPKEI